MKLFTSHLVIYVWFLSELALSLWKRSRTNATSHDNGSLGRIWRVNTVAITMAVAVAYTIHGCRLPVSRPTAFAIMWAGLIFRWYAIIHLGRFFTTNVAIASDQHVVDTGPYRFIRHPSYTGGMITLLGLGLSLGNWASLLLVVIPCYAVLLWRIRIEEQTLLTGLGEPYRNYMRRTKRLVPFIY